MPLIVPANEQGAGFMAAGYARASGKVGVVMVTSGPGATNTATPVRDCMADSIPSWSSAARCPRRDRYGCLSGGAGFRNSWGRWPNICSWSPIRKNWRPRFAPRLKSPAPAARDRSLSTSPKTCRTGRGTFRALVTAVPGYRQRMTRSRTTCWTKKAAQTSSPCCKHPSGR